MAEVAYLPQETVPIRRALLSVSDKTGIVDFARALAGHGVELISTGGTAKALRDAGLAVRDVAELTGVPEMMAGRVKTLHPVIHGGLLGRRDADAAVMAEHGIAPIDLLVVNLYPFEQTVAQGADAATCIENIDIGGPAMIRSAAKNHESVAVVVEPDDYAVILDEIARLGGTTLPTRRRLAGIAYARTTAYDAAIAAWFARGREDNLPARLVIAGQRRQALRYGENPHQEAALYTTGEARPGVATARQLQGKELSYNNILDTDAAYEAVTEFDGPACVIVKHGNPCGGAVADRLAEAYAKANACDPVSAFGGVVAFNRPLDQAAAEAFAKVFTEVVIAPKVEAGAQGILARKPDLRVVAADGVPKAFAAHGVLVRSVAGGFLAQTRDLCIDSMELFLRNEKLVKVMTRRSPTTAELDDLLFAWRVVKHVKSNAIVFARGGATVGIGAGQMSRVDAVRIAVWKAEEAARTAGETTSRLKGSVVASDAFFPFADGLIAAAEAGATAVIQPGGSKRDAEVIAAADERGVAMLATGIRHFRH
ncbi:MAG: bifunctional phosphoribosylaminoimidazolecarboxamide formyltransferase/IMP cyclohydrolase [Alphaproteobacteria bacterium]